MGNRNTEWQAKNFYSQELILQTYLKYSFFKDG